MGWVTHSSLHATKKRSEKSLLNLFFVGQSIEISNPFLEDFKKVIAFVAYINKSPSQEGDLGGG